MRPGWLGRVQAHGPRVVSVPAWDEMENGEWAVSEFSPPSFMQREGAPVFNTRAWDRLRGLHGGISQS